MKIICEAVILAIGITLWPSWAFFAEADDFSGLLLSNEQIIRVAVMAQQEVVISSSTRGVVKKIHVKDGDRFTKDQLILELDCGILEAQKEKAKAMAKRQSLIWESNKRLASLQSKSSLEVAISESEAQASNAELLSMERLLQQCQFTAPFEGRLAALMVVENQYVAEGQPLMEIMDDAELLLEFIAPSQWLSWLTPGFEFVFSVEETGLEQKAVVERLGGRVDPVSQTIKVYATLPSPNSKLKPGMSGAAHLIPPALNNSQNAKTN